MSLNSTTLNGAVGVSDDYVRLASGTGAAVGKTLKVDDEKMLIQNVDLSPTVKVARGQGGTASVAHATGALAVIGLSEDFPIVPKPRAYSYGAAGAIAVAPGTHVLKSGAASAMTLRAPTAAETGMELTVLAADAQAYTLTNSDPGFNNGGTSSDVGTFGGAIGDNIRLRAQAGQWHVIESKNVTLG